MSISEEPANAAMESGKRSCRNLLDVICEQWNIIDATECLPHILRPDGEADTWSPYLIQSLAQLASTTRDERISAVRELKQVWHLRLRRFPESNPDLCATDVDFVNRRWKLAEKALKDNWTHEEREAKIPKLDAFLSPPKWKRRKGNFIDHVESREERRKRKGKGPVWFQTPTPTSRTRGVVTSSSIKRPSRYIELAMDLTSIPDHFSIAQRMKIFRLRDALRVKDLEYLEMCAKVELKERDLVHMRYEVAIYEGLASVVAEAS